MLRLGHRGDTIVEVMIVLAVLGLAVGISYATANRSLLNTRQAQENAEATQLAQGQIEALRTMTGNVPPNSIFNQTAAFCISSSTPFQVQAGAPCNNQGSASFYDISIDCPSTGSGHCTIGSSPSMVYQVTVSWPDIDGQSTDNVTLNYTLYPTP